MNMSSRKRPSGLKDSPKTKKLKSEVPSTSKSAGTAKPKLWPKGHAADINLDTLKSMYLRCLAKPPSNVLWPHMIQFSGKLYGTQKEMHDLVTAHGAKIGSKKVFNLLVATLQEYDGKTNKVTQALKKHVPIVHEMYLYNTILNGRQPDMAYYDLSKHDGSSGVAEGAEVEDDETSSEEESDGSDGEARMRDVNPIVSRALYGKASKKANSNVMRGYTITFSGKFSVSQKQIQDLAQAHGAKLGTKSKFSLLIASADGYDCENAKVLQAEILMVPIVHELFLYDAIIKGKVPKTDTYDLSKA